MKDCLPHSTLWEQDVVNLPSCTNMMLCARADVVVFPVGVAREAESFPLPWTLKLQPFTRIEHLLESAATSCMLASTTRTSGELTGPVGFKKCQTMGGMWVFISSKRAACSIASPLLPALETGAMREAHHPNPFPTKDTQKNRSPSSAFVRLACK